MGIKTNHIKLYFGPLHAYRCSSISHRTYVSEYIVNLFDRNYESTSRNKNSYQY